MTVELYNLLFKIGIILTVIMVIVTIVIFIKFKVPKTIGSLTGVSARIEIKNKRDIKDKNPNHIINKGGRNNKTKLLLSPKDQTEKLINLSTDNETTLLTEFSIEQDITEIHTNEII